MSVPAEEMELDDPTMSDSELVQHIDREIEESLGHDGDELAENRTLAMDYFYGHRPLRPSDESRSGVVSMDLADAVDATVASIMPAFSGDQVASFEPEGSDDVEGSQSESDYVNHVLMRRNDGFTILEKALIDCLLQRNGFTKVWWDERVTVSYETHDGIPPMALPQLLERGPDVTVEVIEQEGDVMEVVTPMGVVMDGQLSVRLRVYTKTRELKIEPIAPEDVLINADHRDQDLQTARFVAHRRIASVSDLMAEGYDEQIIEKLDDYDYASDSQSLARNRSSKEGDMWYSDEVGKEIYECYMLVDYDGDGLAERRKIVYSSSHVLSNEPTDVVCIACGAAYLVPHRWAGRSLFDKLRDIQDAKTELTRQVLDAGRLNINQRLWALEGRANLDDLFTSRTGGVVRVKSTDAIGSLPPVDLPPGTWSLMEYLDKMRRERGGSAIDGASQAQQVAGDTAHGIERTVTLMEQINANVAEVFSETLIRQVFLLIHYYLRQYSQGMVEYQRQGQWQQTMPQQWRPRERVAVSVGLSHGERVQRSASLTGVLSAQKEAMGAQIPITDAKRIYNTLVDATLAGGLDAPERYWIDPQSPEGQQKAQEAAQQAQQAQAMAEQQQAQARQLQEAMITIEGQKNQIKALENEVKSVQEGIKQDWEREKFYERQRFEYDKLETEQGTDIPGEGTSL